jgi:MFS family permease
MNPVGGTWQPPDPAEPTPAEIAAARAWLAQRGVRVAVPTRLLCVRIGARRTQRPSYRYFPLAVLAAILGAVAYFLLARLFGASGRQISASGPMFFVVFAVQAWALADLRQRDRDVLARVAKPARKPGVRLVGGWYFAALAVTFLGGPALALAILLADQDARTPAWSWLCLLVVGAVFQVVAVIGILRGPAIAEDDASLAVDDWLRRRDIYSLVPGLYAVILVMDFPDDNQPAAFTTPAAGYVLVSLAITMVALVRQRRQPLPPGHYGI